MDLAEFSREPIDLTLAGQSFRVRPRPLKELGPLQAWFKRTIRTPLVRAAEAVEQLRRLKLPVSAVVEGLILAQAQREELAWPPVIGSFAWLDAVDRADQAAEVVRYALAPLHPEITLERAKELLEAAEPGEVGTLTAVLFTGKLPDPKASGTEPTVPATTTTNGTTTDPNPSPDATTPPRS